MQTTFAPLRKEEGFWRLCTDRGLMLMGNWISVKESLPKSLSNKVIVSCVSENINDYVGFGHYEKYRDKEVWFNLETGRPFSEWDMTVTHWQELPEHANVSL